MKNTHITPKTLKYVTLSSFFLRNPKQKVKRNAPAARDAIGGAHFSPEANFHGLSQHPLQVSPEGLP